MSVNVAWELLFLFYHFGPFPSKIHLTAARSCGQMTRGVRIIPGSRQKTIPGISHAPPPCSPRRGLGSDQGPLARPDRSARRPGQGQSTLRRCRPVDRQDGGTVARPARTLRQVEHGLAALRPLGAQGRLAEAFRDLPGRRLGVVDPGLHRRPCPPPRRRARKSSGGQAAQSLGRSRGAIRYVSAAPRSTTYC